MEQCIKNNYNLYKYIGYSNINFRCIFAGKVLNNIRESQLYINDKVIYDINEELININNAVTIATTNMYRDNDIITDIIDFLNFDNISYLKIN